MLRTAQQLSPTAHRLPSSPLPTAHRSPTSPLPTLYRSPASPLLHSHYHYNRSRLPRSRADPCLSKVEPSATFLLVATAYEQTHKAQGVLADAGFYAEAAGRVLVEPAVQDSRIYDPWAAGWRGLSLSDYWTLTTLCRSTRLMRLKPFLLHATASALAHSRVDLHVLSRLNQPLMLRGMARSLAVDASAEEARSYFREAVAAAARRKDGSDAPRLVVLHDLKRHRPGDYARIRMETPLPLMQQAHALAHSARSFACVQWRTEGSPMQSTAAFGRCANALAGASLSRMVSAAGPYPVTEAVLLSDLIEGNSDTLHRSAAHAAAKAVLFSRLRLSPLQRAFRAVNDSGVRAMLELHVCARAAIVVTCAHPQLMAAFGVEGPAAGQRSNCLGCVKANSGFTRHLVETRARLQARAHQSLRTYSW